MSNNGNRLNYVLLRSHFSPIEARLEAMLLMSEGLDVQVFDENIVLTNPLYTPAVGGVRLMVAEQDLAAARLVLEKFAQGDYAVDEEELARLSALAVDDARRGNV